MSRPPHCLAVRRGVLIKVKPCRVCSARLQRRGDERAEAERSERGCDGAAQRAARRVARHVGRQEVPVEPVARA
eukprot:6174442-Pleurochrysis_carterae.AAC.2